MKMKEEGALHTAHIVFDALDAKKALQIRVLRVEDRTVLSEYFVLCTALNPSHVSALADEIIAKADENGIEVRHVDGRDSNDWMAVDFGDVLCHIFQKDARNFYALDKLFGDCEEVPFESIDEKAEKEKSKPSTAKI